MQKPKYVYFPYTPLKIGLLPGDRAQLHDRIAARFETMLELGLIGELRELRKRYALDLAMPSMRCVGYRQTMAISRWRNRTRRAARAGIAATRQLANVN
jgi:tRNA dimethylallyltransferase